MSWQTLVFDDVIHVHPLNDEAEHVLSAYCWCRPEIKPADFEHELPIIIHNAADCRELIEQAEEIK